MHHAPAPRDPPAPPYPPYPRFPTRPTPEGIAELFAVQRQADPFGYRLHLFFACAHCFLAGWPTTWAEWAGLPLLICAAVRFITHHRILGPIVWDPPARLILLWAAWTAISMLWTPGGTAAWLADGQALRFALLLPLLYPVLDRSRTLIACLMLGILCGQASQLAHALTVWIGEPQWLFSRDPARISGWWDPVIAGSILVTALGMAIGLLFERSVRDAPGAPPRRSSPLRRLALLAAPAAMIGIVLTATRGAWIAAAGLLVIAALLAALRAVRSRAAISRRSIAMALVGAAAIIVLAAAVPGVRDRVSRGINETRTALGSADYRSDTGMRIAMWRWAWIEFTHHPLRGTGAGGYLPAARSLAASHPHLPLPHAHAHSAYLHTLATLGATGLVILLAMLAAAVRPLRPSGAPAWGLLGLALAGLFDTITINQQTANILFILLTLSVRFRPPASQTAESAA